LGCSITQRKETSVAEPLVHVFKIIHCVRNRDDLMIREGLDHLTYVSMDLARHYERMFLRIAARRTLQRIENSFQLLCTVPPFPRCGRRLTDNWREELPVVFSHMTEKSIFVLNRQAEPNGEG